MHVRPLRQGFRRLSGRDHWEVLGFLRQDPEQNAYLLGQVTRGALDREAIAGPFAGYWDGGSLIGLVVAGSNLVLSAPCAAVAIPAFARFAAQAGYVIRVVVGPDEVVACFMRCCEPFSARVAVERAGQLLYRVDHRTLITEEPCPRLRPADVTELGQLIGADLQMVDEELGYDPFSTDLPAFRRGWLRRIREQRAWVVADHDGTIAFKLDHSATADDVVQLAGIYTFPRFRRRGIARRAIGEMCRLLLEDVPVVSLYVHPDNRGAIGLYEQLGFEAVAHVRSVWLHA